MRTERELLVDCLERLNRLGVPYMLVGSMARNYWGIPFTSATGLQPWMSSRSWKRC